MNIIIFEMNKNEENDDNVKIITTKLDELNNERDNKLNDDVNDNINDESINELDNKLEKVLINESDNKLENVSINELDNKLDNELGNDISTQEKIKVEKVNIFKNIDTLVLSGGGIFGVTHLGALRVLENNKIIDNVKTICGTSVGAIIGCLLSMGYTSTELYSFIQTLDFKKLVNIEFNKMTTHLGLDDGSRMTYVISRLMKKKGFNKDITFKELYEKTQIKLLITATCLNRNCACYFSHETSPEMEVLIAIRMSMSIPIFFTPVNYKNELYTDGGGFDNYPIHLFNKTINNTIGIHIVSDESIIEGFNNIEDYLIRIIQCYRKGAEFHIQKGYDEYTIFVKIGDNSDAGVVNFDLDAKGKEDLYKLGYESSLEFIKKFIKKHDI